MQLLSCFVGIRDLLVLSFNPSEQSLYIYSAPLHHIASHTVGNGATAHRQDHIVTKSPKDTDELLLSRRLLPAR